MMIEKTKTPLSAYAKFHLALDGFDVYLNNSKINRWQVFAAGITNADLILNKKTIYELRPKEDVFGEVA